MALQITAKEKELQLEYETKFIASDYLEDFTSVYYQFNKFSFTSLHRVFRDHLPKGTSLLEVGCGPTIHSVISASRYFTNIVTSDFLDSNRTTVLKWLKNDPSAHDWSHVFKHVAVLEKENDYRKLEERVRKNVKDVICCDVLQPNPLAPIKQQFDVVVTSYCLESAATDVSSYKRAVFNVANLLNPDGTLIIVGELCGTFYYAGSKTFMVPFIDKETVLEALSSVALNVVYWSYEPVYECSHGYDAIGMFVVVATK